VTSGDEDPALDVKTPAVVAAEAAAAEARRAAAEATEELEKLRQQTATDSLARAQSEAAVLRAEIARLQAASTTPQQPLPAISLSPSTSSSSSSSSSASSSSTTSSSSLSSAGAIPPRTSPRGGQLSAWVEYSRECHAQGFPTSAHDFAQWQAVQGVALPPATPTPPRGPALSRVSPQAQYPGGVGSPPMAFAPPSPLGVMPYGAPVAFPGYGQPPPRRSESGNVNIDVARLLALLGTAPSGWQPAPGSGL